MGIKSVVKGVMKTLFKEYQLNRIYSKEISNKSHEISLPDNARVGVIESQEVIGKASDQNIRDHAWYAGEQAFGYGIWEDNDLVCMCWFWGPAHSAIPRRFSQLRSDEAIMVDLLTTEQCRGKGYAALITHFAENKLAESGFRNLWTWVWHSNSPSIRVFEKAGWNYRWFLAEFKIAGFKDFIPLKLPRI